VKPEDTRPERSNDPALDDTAAHPAEAGALWEQFLSRGNLAAALRRVEQNAGAPGIDGMSTKELRPWLKDHWPEVRSALDTGTYEPQPVRRVMIPKPSGGMRKLGVPAAVDRLICQAIAQVLTPVFDPQFHPHSFGFRPGRSQHHAVRRARQFINDGAVWCVDFDLDSFLVPSSHCLSVHGVVSNRACSACGTSIRRPFRRPLRTWIASSSPRFTRCNTVWRETPRARIASRIGM
jgi:RNA-directed DNA polymerase